VAAIVGEIPLDVLIIVALLIFWTIDKIFFGGFFFNQDSEEVSDNEIDNSEMQKKMNSKLSLNSRQKDQIRTCSFGKCRSLAFRSSEYCWKHQEEEPHTSDGMLTENWWEYDGSN